MTNDYGICLHGFQVEDGVFQRLAFDNTAGLFVEIRNICAEPFGSKLEGTSRSCARLVEEIDDSFSSQCRYFFHFACGNFQHGLGCIEDCLDVGAG